MLIYIHKEQMLDDVAAPLPGAPLRDGRRQAAHSRRDEEDLGDALDHGLPAPGPLRARSGRTSRRIPRADLQSSASATCCSTDVPIDRIGRVRSTETAMNATRQLCTTSARASGSTTSRAAMLDDGTLRALHRRSVGDRADLESRRSSTRRSAAATPTTTRSRSKARRASRGEALFFELALEDLTQAADLFRPVHDATGGRRRLGVAGGLAAARRTTPRQRSRRRRSCMRAAHGRICSSRSRARRAGIAGDRGVDLRRRAGQRDAAVLARAVPRRRRGVHARHRAADRRGPAIRRSPRWRRSSSAAGTWR